MRPVTTIDQVFEAMQRARTGASAFCTNLFPDRVRLQGWVDHGELLNCAGDGTTLFLRRDREWQVVGQRSRGYSARLEAHGFW